MCKIQPRRGRNWFWPKACLGPQRAPLLRVLGWLTLGKVGESTAARVSLQEGCARYPIRSLCCQPSPKSGGRLAHPATGHTGGPSSQNGVTGSDALIVGYTCTNLQMSGGEGGIRTPDTRQGMAAFEAARFNHSRTSPHQRQPNCGSADSVFAGDKTGAALSV